MDKEGNIDLERISNSVETLSSIENLVNLVSLDDNFEDIEKCFRQINFEHANCLSYKEPITQIYSDLEHIKRKINELSEALRRTKANYTTISSFSEKEIKEFTQIYKSTPASEDLSKLVGGDAVKVGTNFSVKSLTAALPTPGTTGEMGNLSDPSLYNNPYSNNQNNPVNNQNGNVTTIPAPDTTPQTTNNQPVDTVPIGIAIGATGIVGSIGAVIVDDMYSKKNRKQKKVRKNDVYIEDYNEDEIIDDGDAYESVQRNYDTGIAQGPYRAARFEREADRFYGNQLQGLGLGRRADDVEEEEEDDDTDYDNF